MIHLENVTKKYGDKIAVDNLTLSIPQGELFAFIGPNGAGKTTTVKMLVGLLIPTSGKIIIDGKDINKAPLEARRRLAYIPDQPFAYEKLSGREFLRFTGQMYGVDQHVFQREFDKYVSLFQMSDYIDHLIDTYSLGMKQRLIISAMLLHHPQVIVVDEPLVGLDPTSGRIAKDLFRETVKNNGTTVFMSTHILSVAEETADRIGLIHNGQLIALGTLQELKQQSQIHGKLEDVFLKLVE